MLKSLRIVLFMCIFISIFVKMQEQVRKEAINILNANRLDYDEAVVEAQILVGNVQFEHNKTRMNCDSANFFQKTNSLHAFKRVRIFQGDSLNITADTLYYEGNNSLARLRGNIAMRKGLTTLYTDSLDYNVRTETAYYQYGGKIVSEQDKNTIESVQGTFFSTTQDFIFEQNVVVTNQKYTMKSDSLRYNTDRKTAYFIAPTDIVSDSNRILTSAGYYNTEFEFAKLAKDNILWSKEQQLIGDYIFYDRNASIGEAFGNVILIDTVKKVEIYGHQGVFYENSGYSIFTKNPYVRVLTQKSDSLYIAADTLYTERDSILNLTDKPIQNEEEKFRKIMRIRAYHKAISYNENIQSFSDSLVYTDIDSTLRLYQNPFLWATTKNTQVSGDSIILKFSKDNQLQQLDVFAPQPLSIAKPFDPEENSNEYNQVLSHHITAFFREESKPKEIIYKGPIQSVYYLGEEKENKVWDKIAMNKTGSASDMKVEFGFSGDVERIVYFQNPRSTVYNMQEIPEKDRFLEGFNWKIELKPTSYQFVKKNYEDQQGFFKTYQPKVEDFIAPQMADILRRELGITVNNPKKNNVNKKKK